jgi:siroheme synthase (precorrin-2 oxidase/ferrochelatase)
MAAELLAKMEGEPQSEEERLREAVKRNFIKERKRKAAVEKAIEEARAGDKSEKGGE